MAFFIYARIYLTACLYVPYPECLDNAHPHWQVGVHDTFRVHVHTSISNHDTSIASATLQAEPKPCWDWQSKPKLLSLRRWRKPPFISHSHFTYMDMSLQALSRLRNYARARTPA